MSFVAVGRKYGVSDNAVRKWLRWYEYQEEREGSRGQAEDQRAA
jgi:transposase-like protein